MLPHDAKLRLTRAALCAGSVSIATLAAALVAGLLFGWAVGGIALGAAYGGIFGTVYGHYQGETATVERIRSYLHREDR